MADLSTSFFKVSGDESTGKPAIVHTVARWLKEAGRLGSFFCFDVEKLFTMITRDLVNFDQGLRQAVADWAISLDTSLLITDILLQWQRLVLGPLRKSSPHLGPVVLVIDALDECGPAASREPILHILADESTQLPPNVCVLVTSLPTSNIRVALQDKSHVRATSLDGLPHENGERDIYRYISHRLHAFRDEQYAFLTSKADGSLANELSSFSKNERFLPWLEALGLLGCIDEVHAMLGAATRLIEVSE